MNVPFRNIRATRLADEVGTIHKQAELSFALCYPSPYPIGMSSLGFQTIYRGLNALPGVSAERAFLPDDVRAARATGRAAANVRNDAACGRLPGRRLLAGLRAGVGGPRRLPRHGRYPALRRRARRPPRSTPAGGRSAARSPSRTPSRPPPTPTSCCSARPRRRSSSWSRRCARRRRARRCSRPWRRAPASTCPPVHGERPPAVAAADDTLLPAHSQIRTPHTELSDMFLIEPERGCSPRLHLLRDAPLDQRRHAPRRPGEGGARSSRPTCGGWAWSAPR